jgi:hypothetical protein
LGAVTRRLRAIIARLDAVKRQLDAILQRSRVWPGREPARAVEHEASVGDRVDSREGDEAVPLGRHLEVEPSAWKHVGIVRDLLAATKGE